MKNIIYTISTAIFVAGIFISCCTTSKMNMKPPEQVSLPPQNADIKISILEIVNSGGVTYCNARINEITGYGASTPPLSPGQIIKINFPASMIDQKKVTADEKLYIRASWLTQRDASGYWNFEKINEIN